MSNIQNLSDRNLHRTARTNWTLGDTTQRTTQWNHVLNSTVTHPGLMGKYITRYAPRING